MGHRTCSCCGVTYATKGGEDVLIYGCRACHKGTWQLNQQELAKTERNMGKAEKTHKYGAGHNSKLSLNVGAFKEDLRKGNDEGVV